MLKNKHFQCDKSTLQTVNTVSQTIGSTAATLQLGSIQLHTGMAISVPSPAIWLENTGVYRVHVNAQLVGTTAGVVTLSILNNSSAVIGGSGSVTVPVGSENIVLDTLIEVNNPCMTQNGVAAINVTGVTDGTAVTTVTSLLINVEKIA